MRPLWRGQARLRFRLRARGECLLCAFPYAAVAGLRECHVADACCEIGLHRRPGHHVTQEMLPADAIGILEWSEVIDLLPVRAIVDIEVRGDGEMRCARRDRKSVV